MADYEFLSRSLDDTAHLGVLMAQALAPGDVCSFTGTLGAGKTRLIQAIAAGLGVEQEQVTSPTFVLVNEYRSGRLPIYHLDAYRLKDDDEFLELGPEEMCDSGGVTLIEWGDRVAHLLPPRLQTVAIEFTPEGHRRITVDGDLARRLTAQGG